jgi:hypothetical protein
MRIIIYLVGLLLFLGCNPENTLDCFQSSGEIVSKNFTVKKFNKIQVWERVQLFIEQGDIQKIRVETGENLLNEIKLTVKDSVLTISDRNSCNFIRDYDVTKVYVTSPNIKQIRNSSGLTVESIGVLRYSFLDLVSEDRLNIDEYHIDGDFRLSLDCDWVNINANGISRFYLTGKTWGGFFGLYGGDVRVEAENLEIQQLSFYHRSTNQLIVNPQQAIRGEIRSLGDVISMNRPPIVEVEELFRGRLIFE